MWSKMGCDRALSLIEVLVAVAILAVVFVPVFRLFMHGVEATKYTEDRLRAFSIARRQIEAIRHANHICRSSQELLTKAFAANPGFAPYVVDGRYRVETVVDPDFKVSENGSEATVTYVAVTVSWTMNGADRELELETFLDRSYN